MNSLHLITKIISPYHYKFSRALLVIIMAVAWLAVTIMSAIASDEIRDKQPNIYQEKLSNGLDVIIIEDHRIPAVSHNLLFRLGAADDPVGKSGLAHYLEHMLFQGTHKYAANEYSRIVAAKGGRSNAFTNFDYTGYWVNTATDNLAEVMMLEADRFQNLNPTEEDFTKEKQVILEERRTRVENNPNALFAEQIRAILYYHHPYGTPVIGWHKEMAALTRDDVMDYYQQFYHLGNATLVLAGDIKANDAMNMVRKYYGNIAPRNGSTPPRVDEPPQLGARYFTMHHQQVKQPKWQRKLLVPSYGWRFQQNKHYILPLMVAEYLLGGSKASRLYRRLVEQEKLATGVAVSYNAFRNGPGEFSIYVTPINTESIKDIELIISEEIAKLRNTPPDNAEIQRAKAQLIADNVYIRDGLQPLAKVIGHLRMLGLPLDYYFTWEEKIDAITAEDVAASLQLLDMNYSVTGVLLPKAADNKEIADKGAKSE